MTESVDDLMESIARDLNSVLTPVGVLKFWSSPLTYLDGARGCDVYRDRDVEKLTILAARTASLRDSSFS